MNQFLVIHLILLGFLNADAQDYLEMMNSLYDASKSREVMSAKISYIEEKEDGTQVYSQYVYSDNRNTTWRAIHQIEQNETLYFDGLHTTYYFNHGNRSFQLDTGRAAVVVFKNKMGTISQMLLARKGSGLSGLVENAIPEVCHEGKGLINLKLNMPGELGYNLADKKANLLLDSIKWIPLQYIDTVYFLERLVRIEENLELFSISQKTIDSMHNQVNLWLNTYSHYKDTNDNIEIIKLFPYKQIFDRLQFINQKPSQTDYYLFDFYFAGCVPCYQCLPFIKALEMDLSDRLTIVAINPIDRVERIERYNRINSITYPSAILSNGYLSSIAGTLSYPTYILYDSNKNEIARAMDCDPSFFEHVAEIISRD